MGIIIRHWKRYRYVNYYTVQNEDSTQSEVNKFFIKFKNDKRLDRAMYRIAEFVAKVGDNVRMPRPYFVFEGEAERFNETGFIEVLDRRGYGLRLYCRPISDHIVFIFNGCEKTTHNAQDCPNCSGHFYFANSISRKIISALNAGEIRIDRSRYNLEIDEDFLIND